jgi:hypothetical protein
MARYPLGQPITLATTVREVATGALVDPATLTLTIRRPDGTSLPAYTYNPGAVARDALGTFHLDVPTTDLVAVGHHPYTWVSTGPGAGAGVGSFDIFDPFEVSVLSLPDAKDHLNIARANTQYDALIQIWLDTIESEIERAIGGPVITRAVSERVEATDGGRALPLRKRPVVAITSITSLMAGQAIDISDVEVDPNANIARHRLGWPFLAGGFGPPVLTVAYTAGLGTSVPAQVSAAARIILDHLWAIQRGPSARPSAGGEDVSQVFGMSFAIPNRALELLGANLVEAWV